MPPEVVKKWCLEFPETLFITDEAYAEFTETSVLSFDPELSNLHVLRSFSKAWLMAGLRLGVICGPRNLLAYIEKVRLSFNVNAAAICALRALKPKKEIVEENARRTMVRKSSLVTALRARGLRIIEGQQISFFYSWANDVLNSADFSKNVMF